MLSQGFKSFLFFFFPYRLIRFVKKHFTLSYILFGESKTNIGQYIINISTPVFSVHHMEQQLGKEVVAGFKQCYDEYISRHGVMREYLLACNNCIIEPEYGWGIDAGSDKLIFDSVANNAWLESYHPAYFRYRKNKRTAGYYPEIVSIRIIKGGEKNYWHFLQDLLGQVALAKKNNLGSERTIPYLISESLAAQPFFQKALTQSRYLANLHWIVQKNSQYIRAGTAYFLQVQPNKKETFFAVRELFDVPMGDCQKNRKVFLTRNPNRIRHLRNATEIETIAKKHAFEIVDADNLSFEQQIQLFSQTRFLIGIHGAGLTNIIFRLGAPMQLLELLPKNYLQPHYFWLSSDMGFGYDCLVGTKAGADTSFSVSPEDFELKLQELLAQEETGEISVSKSHSKNQII